MIKFNIVNSCSDRIHVLINNKTIAMHPDEKKQCYEKEGSNVFACLPNQNAKKLSFGVVDGSDKVIFGL